MIQIFPWRRGTVYYPGESICSVVYDPGESLMTTTTTPIKGLDEANLKNYNLKQILDSPEIIICLKVWINLRKILTIYANILIRWTVGGTNGFCLWRKILWHIPFNRQDSYAKHGPTVNKCMLKVQDLWTKFQIF